MRTLVHREAGSTPTLLHRTVGFPFQPDRHHGIRLTRVAVCLYPASVSSSRMKQCHEETHKTR
jgi:hypothetical protein